MKYFARAVLGFSMMVATIPALAFDGLKVYPNPARADQGQTSVTFDQVPDPVRFRIFNLRGQQVRDEERAGAAQFVWDLTNDAGEPVAPGIYFYILTDSQGRVVRGKLAVIR